MLVGKLPDFTRVKQRLIPFYTFVVLLFINLFCNNVFTDFSILLNS